MFAESVQPISGLCPGQSRAVRQHRRRLDELEAIEGEALQEWDGGTGSSWASDNWSRETIMVVAHHDHPRHPRPLLTDRAPAAPQLDITRPAWERHRQWNSLSPDRACL